jgi:hypothetical protein
MNPKEKAIELVNKYLQVYDGKVKEAKQCALIAIDELIKQEEKYNNGTFYPSKYWKEVKQEIINI